MSTVTAGGGVAPGADAADDEAGAALEVAGADGADLPPAAEAEADAEAEPAGGFVWASATE
jgi:hypothetical protein